MALAAAGCYQHGEWVTQSTRVERGVEVREQTRHDRLTDEDATGYRVVGWFYVSSGGLLAATGGAFLSLDRSAQGTDAAGLAMGAAFALTGVWFLLHPHERDVHRTLRVPPPAQII